MKYTNTQIEKSLKQAVEDVTPNVLPQILQRIGNGEEKTTMKNTININFKGYKKFVGIAAAIVLLVASIFSYTYFTPQTTISFDVNPSIELRVNASEKVLSATALNDDAKIILSNMKLKNVDLDVAVNALIGSMIKNGYIDDVKNSILISVDSNSTQKSEELQQRLSGEVNAVLNNYSLQGAVLSQTLTSDETVDALAQEYNISNGKAALVKMLVAKDPKLNFKEVAALSINDINLLLDSYKVQSAQVASNGSASSNAYIGDEKAKSIAFSHAGVKPENISGLKVKMDYEDGQMVYEVDFYNSNTKYEYEINALNGSVLAYTSEVKGIAGGNSDSGSYIGEDKAKTIAYNHAGVKAADVTLIKSKLDHYGQTTIYEIDFISGENKYNYDIDAVSGSIIKVEKKVYGSSTSGSSSGSGSYIGEDKAKTIAYNHAGVKAADVTLIKSKLDHDDGIMQYEIEFISGGYKYEYDIDATSGTVIKSEKKVYGGSTSGSSSGTGSYIGEDKAKTIAYNHAGVKAADITRIKSKLDHDDGAMVYEIEFISGGYKYEYDIDATSGTVIKSEKKVYGASTSGSSSGTGSYIGEDKAKTIAYNHAGVKATDVTLIKSKLDHDDGVMVYEIEFVSGGMEYEYEIDAQSGTILKYESERD